jgi:Cd2+/Zn2+-exporting ATPase
MLAGTTGHPAFGIGLYVVAAGIMVLTPAVRAVRSLRAKALDINVLMMIAAMGAAALHDWLEAAVVLWLFGVAQWLEAMSMDRARRAIRSLVALAPTTALVRRGGAERLVDVASVLPGEIVVVRPGERAPIDGTVVRGRSAVNQAPVTGESMPADKEPGDGSSPEASTGPGPSTWRRCEGPRRHPRRSQGLWNRRRSGARRFRPLSTGLPAATRRPSWPSP